MKTPGQVSFVMNIQGLYLQSEPWLREQIKVMSWCIKNDVPCYIPGHLAPSIPDGFIPVGNVEFVENALGRRVIPDYDPKFACAWMKRSHGTCGQALPGSWFYKPLDRYKRFDGIACRNCQPTAPGPYWYSEIVNFTNEWRYYIANGDCLTAAWYKGDNENEPPPELGVRIPKEWCGTIDMGRMDNGEIALVECHHPYACGWYGDDTDIYVKWLVKGWEYMKGLIYDNKTKDRRDH